MKILVTKTMPAAADGVHTQRYRAGETYEMPDDLGAVFVRERWGKELKEEPPKVPQDPPKGAPRDPPKSLEGGGDNKGGKGPDENK